MIHLRSFKLRQLPNTTAFPFSMPLIQPLRELSFETPITLLVGENGSGKSTFLETLACAAEMNAVGGKSTRSNESLVHARELAKYFHFLG